MDLVISDIHADISALDAILDVTTSQEFQQKFGKFSRIINLGDLLERGTHPKEVISRINSLSKIFPLESIMGNHDEAFLYRKTVSGSSLESIDAHNHISENDLLFFKENKDGTFGRQEFVDKKNKLMCVHGGPLNPKKIIPKNIENDTWLYQKTWQRITQEKSGFFSHFGYHYTPSSAFAEVENHLNNFLILCGHQHEEALFIKFQSRTQNMLPSVTTNTEKIQNYFLSRKEIPIDSDKNYIIRLGLGGPEGYYGVGEAKPHFAILQDNPRKAILFTIGNQ